MDRSPLQRPLPCLLLLFCAGATPTWPADQPADATCAAWAVRLEGEAPRLDGVLDEAAWATARWTRGLTQKDPVEGLPGAELTEVAFLFDETSLYVGARLQTPLTGPVASRLSPRDDMGQTQSFFISLDTYHDHRTACTMGVTAAGVRVDFYHPTDEEFNQVMSWDPVWDVRTRIEPHQWCVEARIPFSQLRFNPGDEQVWGLQLDRWSPERNAEDYWVMIPRAQTGWASRFGELRGIRDIRPSRRIELLPYVAGEARLLHDPDPLDPFSEASDFQGRAGGDLKMGLGPNLTLDATLNPDFGQVEADPAQLNLTAFETVFEERRPFFLEGDRLLRGQGPRYYYSRRIGAPPPYPALADTVTHIDQPSTTSIQGAAKLSGRLPGGLSIAALTALTDEEVARIHNVANHRSDELLVQPRTLDAVLRLQQDFSSTGSLVGLSLTSLRRALRGDSLLGTRLPREAVTGGLDWNWRFRDGLHAFSGYGGFSRVAGDPGAILRLQRSPAHYFQRSDVSHLHLDGGRRALTGWTGQLGLERLGGRHWRWSVGSAAESPGFDLNELGQLSSADDVDSWLTLTWEENQGVGLFRRYTLWHNYMASWNFGGLPTNREVESGFWSQFQNYWSLEGGFSHGLPTFSDDLSRGGATLGEPGWNYARLSLSSPDLQRPDSYSLGVNCSWSPDRQLNLDAWTFERFRPGANVEIRVNPSISRNWVPAQYVTTLGPGQTGLAGDLTLFSRMDYREARVATRLRYTLSPRLRLEFYAEPFMASVRFTDPGRPAGARSQNIRRYAAEGRVERGPEGQWLISEEAGLVEVHQPNLEFSSWRSTLVLRWDWRLGSSFYVVWQQDRERFQQGLRMEPDRTPDPLAALNAGGDNLIALKLSAWLPLG